MTASTPTAAGTPPSSGPDAYFAPPRDHWCPLANRPLLCLCLAFVIGLWLADRLGLPLLVWLLISLVCAGAYAALRSTRCAQPVLWLGALALGGLLQAVRSLPRSDDIAGFVRPGTTAMVEGFVAAELPPAGDRRQLLVAAERLWTAEGERAVSGNVLARARGVEGLLDGAQVRCLGKLWLPERAGNPGQFDYAAALARRHTSVILRAARLEVVEAGRLPFGMWVRRSAAQARQAIVRRLSAAMPGANRELYTGLVCGIVWGMQVTPIPQEIADSFRRTGAIHVLVVSGAQVTMIAGILLFLTGGRWFTLSWWRQLVPARLPWDGAGSYPDRLRLAPRVVRWWHAAIVATVLAFVALMVGVGPSVMRAIAMFALFLIAGAGGLRRLDYDPYTALGLAAALVCAFDPSALFSVGAQLSFAATLGVVLGLSAVPRRRGAPGTSPGPVGRSFLARRARGTVQLAAAALGAWLLVTPLLAHNFSAFPVLGALANVAIVPLAGGVLVCGLLAMALSFVWLPAAAVASGLARGLVNGMLQANAACERLPLAYVDYAHFPVAAGVAWYGVLALGAMAVRGRWWQELPARRWGVVLLGVAVVLSIWFAATARPPSEMVVTFLDVGHGQCCVVQSPSGHTMLVDAGSGYSTRAGEECAREVILPFLALRGISRLSLVVLTHPDADHCSALPLVVQQVPVHLVLEGGPGPSRGAYADFRSVADRQAITFERAVAGGRIDLGEGVVAEVLWPTGTPSDATWSDNNRSVVLYLRYGKTGVLLPADIEEPVEEELLRRGGSLAAQVLQVPHHGAKEALSRDFLDAVGPEWAVVSCRVGDPDHPHPSVVGKLQKCGATVVRTDLDGAITIRSDGRRVRVESHASQRRAQNRSPDRAATWARASRRASGSLPASVASRASLSRRGLSILSAN